MLIDFIYTLVNSSSQLQKKTIICYSEVTESALIYIKSIDEVALLFSINIPFKLRSIREYNIVCTMKIYSPILERHFLSGTLTFLLVLLYFSLRIK